MHREIPYNYTSADDRQAVSLLFGPALWEKLEELRSRRVTGRSARLLVRCFGDIFIHLRNPFLYQELLDSTSRRRRFFRAAGSNLDTIESGAGSETRVTEVVRECREKLAEFRRELRETRELRQRLARVVGPIVGRKNVLSNPFALVSHATDATDWRLYLPVAVVMPTEESQVPPLLAALADLKLHAIPRGAGTGLTGGCVPVKPRCVMINTEKLDRIRGIRRQEFLREDGSRVEAPVMELEAGVVTEDAMSRAAAAGLVFATDPTSAWASTIGGNIAENAGGKTTVLYGTAIDNLISYTMALPGGRQWRIRRERHPFRKILPGDEVVFEVRDKEDRAVRTIRLAGTDIRKKGLWKDITNKALGGLPGVQKEGTDGVITSAEFILYPAYEFTATLCLEFFGPDMDEASKVIRKIVDSFPNRGEEALKSLEHFDDRYVGAIHYKVKAPRGEAPKAVLLIDLVAHTQEQTDRGLSTLKRLLEGHDNTCVFVAEDEAEARRFWQDRKKLGAIAARTNAFKLNEDIVLPLESLAAFARFVDELNVAEERHNQITFARRAAEYLQLASPGEDPRWLSEKIPRGLELCEESRKALEEAGEKALRGLDIPQRLLQDLLEHVRGYTRIAEDLEAIYHDARSRILVVATHMHAGDGNVHVNIPILSNDRSMMRRADKLVDKVMERVVDLGGVVSGEHGIGVTKFKYLESVRVEELEAYRREVDPGGLMNPGKLSDAGVLDQIFTPSFNLLGLEARILQHGSLEKLATKIAQCVRCGRCKPDCCVFHPHRGLFYHPRNKNLAIGSLIEALLYDAQRERSTGFELLRHLEDVADHCTICHKCETPCPVDIDTGEVTVLERQILAARRYKHVPLVTRLTLKFLDSRSRLFNKIFHGLVLRLGGAVQRAGARLSAPLLRSEAFSRLRPLGLLRSRVAPVDPGTLRDVLPPCEPDQVLVIEPEGKAKQTVFYFPGCGSERMFSRISMAAIHLLLESETRVILPPPFLCCGFPAYANARTEQHDRTILRDTILFSQIREMFSYLSFDACVVTCGTCKEALTNMEAQKIFECPIQDVARCVRARELEVSGGGTCLYHAPCHDSLDGEAPEILKAIGGYQLEKVPHCCSEAGTLALSRPDISDSMLHRKRAALLEAARGRPAPTVVLTNCPSCIQGLGRNEPFGVAARHIVVELALRRSGEDWEKELRRRAARAQAIRF